MVLVRAFGNGSVPDRHPANLIDRTVALDHQEVATPEQQFLEFAIRNANLLDLIESKFVGMDIGHPEVGKLSRQLKPFRALGQAADHFCHRTNLVPSPGFRMALNQQGAIDCRLQNRGFLTL